APITRRKRSSDTVLTTARGSRYAASSSATRIIRAVSTPYRERRAPATQGSRSKTEGDHARMDTQRLILFLIFAFSALFLWEAWQKEHAPAPPPVKSAPKSNELPSQAAAPPPGAPSSPAPVPGEAAPSAAGQTITIKTDLYTAEVDTVGGTITLVAL